MRATRYDAEQRYELFAKFRAQNPGAEFDEIMDHVFDVEDEIEQVAHEQMLDAQDDERRIVRNGN